MGSLSKEIHQTAAIESAANVSDRMIDFGQ